MTSQKTQQYKEIIGRYMTIITEDYLKENFGLNHGGEISLPQDCQLTLQAQALLSQRDISIRYINQQGEVFSTQDGNKEHPLKRSNTIPDNQCIVCGCQVTDKPAYMTHLDDKHLVVKTHPRLVFRGQIDALIGECVEIQCLLAQNNVDQVIQNSLSDIRSYLGQVMQAEVLNTPLRPASIAGKDSKIIHKWSHFPLKYLGYDHMLPDSRFGLEVAKLNRLRTGVRQLELSANHLYIDAAYHVSREDIITGLNSLSSVIYVVMIMLWQIQQGNGKMITQLLAE